MMRLLYWVLGVTLACLFATTLSGVVYAQEADEGRIYWDRGNLLVKSRSGDSVKTTLPCFVRREMTQGRDPADAAVECLEAAGIPGDVIDSVRTLRGTTEFDDGDLGKWDSKPPGIKKLDCWQDVDDPTPPSCRIEYVSIREDVFVSNGVDAGGTAIFISPDGGKRRIYVNGTVQDTDDMDDIPNGTRILGTSSMTWQENSFYHIMEPEFEPTRDKFVKNCQKHRDREDCGTTKEQAHGAFTQIWRTCVVATGSVQADISNASNCLREYTGVKLNLEELLSKVPNDPQQYLDTKNCGIKTAGYILCPLLNFMAGAADGMFDVLTRFLHVTPLDPEGESGKNAQIAWKVFVNIANIVFVILFMMIVWSQVTGLGFNNYSIKRMLPRLIVGAVLVNASFYICIGAIDLSNILGKELQRVMVLVNDQVTETVEGAHTLSADMTARPSFGDSGGWSETIQGILAAGVVAGGLVAATAAVVFTFIPVLTAVILAIVTVALTLIIRYGLILILTIVSPIAFALYFLPNTQKWFTKWRTLFTSLLLLYPIISLVFGLSTLAANIIMNVASAQNAQILAMFALAIQAIPLVVAPIIMKSGGQMLGNIGNNIRNNKLFNNTRGYAGGAQKAVNNKMKARALEGKSVPFGRTIRAAALSKAKGEKLKATAGRERARHVTDYMNGVAGSGGEKASIYERAKAAWVNRNMDADDPERYNPKSKGEKYQDRMLGIGDEESKDRAAAYAFSAQHKAVAEEIKAHSVVSSGKSPEEITREINQRAANDMRSEDVDSGMLADATALMQSGDALQGRLVIEMSGETMSDTERQMLVDSMQKNSYFMAHPDAQQAVKNGKLTGRSSYHKRVIEPNITGGTFSASDIKSMSSNDRQILTEAYHSGDLSPEASRIIEGAARDAVKNDKVSKHLSESEVSAFAQIGTSSTP